MNIYITGIKGFMGAHMSHYFEKQGHNVAGCDNDFHPCQLKPTGIIHNADIRNLDLMDYLILSHKTDVVIHLAAQLHVDYSIKYPHETMNINAMGTLNILEVCRKNNIKCIVASTSEIYGSSQTDFMDETHPLDAQSPYGASKVAGDRLAKSYIDTYDQDIIIIRNFNAFGPYQNDGTAYGSVIAKFTRAALTGESLFIYGDGTQVRDYMDIKDVLQAYDFTLYHLPRGVYNFGTGEEITIKDLAETIIRVTQSKSRIFHVAPRAGEVQRLCCNCDKAKSFGFKPQTSFLRDLCEYVAWYEKTLK